MLAYNICQILCLCAYISLSLNGMSLGQVEFEYAKCNNGEDSCRDCYTELVREVFGNDDNVFSLNKAFFPPRTNPAEFVVITYFFENESMNEPAVWFWTEQSSYFLHPLHTFQFLSLLFGKPEQFYTQQAKVTLNATNCWPRRENDEHLELFTQRLKTYVQKQDIQAPIDNTYIAKAVNHAILRQILTNRGNEITSIIVTLQCVMIVFVVVVVITVMAVQSCSHKWPNKLQNLSTVNKYIKKKQATILGVAIIGYLLILYILALDSAALEKRGKPIISAISSNSTGIHFKNKTSINDTFTLLYEIPGIVLGFDLIGGVFSSLMMLFSMCFNVKVKNYNCGGNTFLFLRLSTIGFICSLVTHSPFIAIAYLNDAYHAGSIFIYYTIVILVLFALIEQLIISCQKKIIYVHNSEKEIQLKGTWILEKGLLHALISDNQHQLKLQDGTLEIKSGKVQVDFEKIESEIILEIKSGILRFESDNTFFSQEQLQPIVLDVKKLPIVSKQHCQDDKYSPKLMFSGLKPKQDQKLNVQKVTTETNGQNIKKVEVGKTKLVLQRAGKLQYSSLRIKAWGCGAMQTSLLWSTITFMIAVFVILFTLAIVVILTCYFVIIPINRSISDAPNRLVGIYESAIVLVGAYIAYKAFFKAKKYLEKSVVKRESPLTDPFSQDSKDKWKAMSDEEKLAQFYGIVVDIIADKKRKCEVEEDEQEEDAGSQDSGEADDNSDQQGSDEPENGNEVDEHHNDQQESDQSPDNITNGQQSSEHVTHATIETVDTSDTEAIPPPPPPITEATQPPAQPTTTTPPPAVNSPSTNT